MSQQFEFLAQKTIGDDVAGPFTANNSELNPNTKNGRFQGFAKFSENFVSYVSDNDIEANWIEGVTLITGDFVNDRINWNAIANGGNNQITFDLWSQGVFPSDTNWTLRWKMTINNITQTGSSQNWLSLGLFAEGPGVATNNPQTFICTRLLRGAISSQIDAIAHAGFNVNIASFQFGDESFEDDIVVGTLFYEMKRTSATTYEITQYSDADYKIVVEKVKQTCSSSIVDLRFIKLQSRDGTAVGGTLDGVTELIQFFNNTEGLQNFLTVKSNTLDPRDFEDSFSSYGSDIVPNFIEDFLFVSQVAADAVWTTTDSAKANIQFLEGFLFFSAVADGTNDAIAHDLTSVSDTEWVLRSEFNLTDIDNGGDNIDKRIFFGIFDLDETADAGTNQDGIFLDMRTDLVPGDRIRMSAVNNADPGTSVQLGTFADPRLVPLLNQKYFVEIKRISTTDMEVGFYTDNTYSNAIEVIRVATLPAGITNLRFLKMMNEPVTGNGKLDLTFKNLDFWNATNVTRTPIADSYVQQGTDIVINKERSLIDFDGAVQNSLVMLTTDTIGTAFGNVWSLRFKLIIKERVQGADADPVVILIGLDQRDGTETLNQTNTNFVGFRITISSTINEIRGIATSSSGGDDNPTVPTTGANQIFTTLPDPGTYYCEITKNADTFAMFKIWRDKDFTDLIEAIRGSSQPIGLSLRFFKVANSDAGNGTEDSTLIGTVDDIQIWNGIRDPDGYGVREYLLQSSLVKFGSGTMQVADIVSGDNSSNPGGSQYKIRNSLNGGAETTGDTAEGTMAQGMVNSDVFIESFMNQDLKSVNSLALAANNVGLTVPDKMVSIWRYQDFPQLEKLTLLNTAGGLYGTDSRTTVWGSIP